MSRRRRVRFRPAVERLEGRSVPAVLDVTTTADTVDPADGLLSLREAISQANADPGDDVIQLQAGATYELTRRDPAQVPDSLNDVGDLDIDSAAGALTIQVVGTGKATITAENLELTAAYKRVLHVNGTGDANIRLDDLVITGGLDVSGGGIRAEQVGRFVMSRCIVEGNQAAISGGGLDVAGTVVVLSQCVVRNNRAAQGAGLFGGGSGVLTVTQCTFQDNVARSFGGGLRRLGGIQTTIEDCLFEGNRAGHLVTEGEYQGQYSGFAAGAEIAGNATISRTIFRRNVADGATSALGCYDSVTLSGLTVEQNQ